MAVEHETSPATRPFQDSDRLEPSRLHFLQLHLVSASRQVAGDPASYRGLFTDEAGDANERLGQFDERFLVDVLQNVLRCTLINHASSPCLTGSAQQRRTAGRQTPCVSLPL